MPGEYMQKVAGVARKSGSAGRGRGGGKGNGRGQGKGGRSGGKGKDKPAKVKRVKEVVFDEGARKEHLLGMRKRKAERRKFGLDMQKFKDRKVILQERKERRELVREKYDEALALKNRRMQGHAFEEDETEDIMRGGLVRVLAGEAAVEEMELPASGTSETVFDDEHTSARFGDGVTVMTSFGLPDSDEEDGAKPGGLASSDEEEGEAEEDGEEETELTNAAKRRKLEGREDAKVTLFQRIQNKSKGRTLPKKRKGDKGKKRGDFVVDKKKQAIMGKKNTDKKKGAKTRMAKKNNVKGKSGNTGS